MNPTTSLLDRANLDRDQVRHEVARGLSTRPLIARFPASDKPGKLDVQVLP
jgi:hypothetical protein